MTQPSKTKAYKDLNSAIPQMDRVLIVDDDLMLKVMFEDILHAHGYKTYHASNGREAVRLVKEHTPEIILMDIVMPEMDGIAACKAIRSITLPVRPSIVVVSNISDKDAIVEALEKGADDFIIKPIDGMELIARIHAQSRIKHFYMEICEDKKNLETILDVVNTVCSTLNTEAVLYTIVNKVANITGAVRCSIVLIAKGNIGYVLASSENPTVKELIIDLNKYPEIMEAIKSKGPVVVEDISIHPLMVKVKELVKDFHKMNVLIMPIVLEEEIIGTLFLRTRRPGKGFTEKDINLCQIIAQAACHAIKNARLFEEVSKEKEDMKALAITDRLTEVYNHNFFYTRLDDEFNRASRYETPISLIMMDIDDFKRINDTYGHRTGDHVLKEIADMIKKLVRKTDIVARYGGEEFSVILPHTNLSGAEEEAERIREAVSNHTYANLSEEIITMSFGVVSYPSGKTIMNAGDFVNLADSALYEAKRSGKNKVVVLGRK